MIWEEDYVVRHLSDSHGNDVDVWFHAELHVQPPWSGARCPACGDFGVKTFPRGYLSRHPEIRPPVPVRPAAPDPAPVAGDVEVTPVPVPRQRALISQLRTHALLYTVIGLSVLLFASFEVLRVTHPVH